MSDSVTRASVGQGDASLCIRTRTRPAKSEQPATALATETIVTPDVILALYDWEMGNCFRCACADVYTTRLDEIVTPSGDAYDLRACGECILALERERYCYAKRRGLEYRPGSLGS